MSRKDLLQLAEIAALKELANLRNNRIIELAKELNAARDELAILTDAYEFLTVAKFIDACDEAKSLRKDAERYRFMRRTEDWEAETQKIENYKLRSDSYIAVSGDEVWNASGEVLDRVVDELMSREAL
jgi:hypothetical protein